jgi:hypothetical protein
METELLSDRITLRVAPERLQEWKELADQEERALSNWVVWMVEKCRKQQQAGNS